MKICIISSQILGFGKIGGFGSMTRKLATALAKSGHDVSVVVPRKGHQKFIEYIDGITIYGLGFSDLFNIKNIYKQIDADIYHSQNPNILSFFATIFEPNKKHVITCRDPRDFKDWVVETKYATWPRRLKTPLVLLLEAGPLISYAVKKADVVGTPANFLRDKVANMYGRKDAILLPNLENIPDTLPQKSDTPTVCYVGRLDKRKRPELVFYVAKKFPNVEFLMVGKAEDATHQQSLEAKAATLPNVKMLGYIDKHSSTKIEDVYNKSWILINTAAREGLPLTFIEAAAHGCAILSQVNPDEFASNFGFWAQNGNFEEGLEWLLEDNRWRDQGEKGFKYVTQVYDEEKALSTHAKLYIQLLQS